jgi:hypothetical protein
MKRVHSLYYYYYYVLVLAARQAPRGTSIIVRGRNSKKNILADRLGAVDVFSLNKLLMPNMVLPRWARITS